MADAGMLVLDRLGPRRQGPREALCTLGNDRLATRGAALDSRADGVHYPGIYAAGIYNRFRIIENESMVNLPNRLGLQFAIGDGSWVDLSSVRVLQHPGQGRDEWALTSGDMRV